MPLKILHTADWHIGQVFYDWDRTAEHAFFLNWLIDYIQTEKIDVLLMAGDVFDVVNPSTQSIKLFHQFLKRLMDECPQTKSVFIAGNHDSALRLETIVPLIDSSRIHLIGTLDKWQQLEDLSKWVFPITKDAESFCAVAIPFVRMGDYPNSIQTAYIDGVNWLYEKAIQYAQTHYQGMPIIALGHMHAYASEISDDDKLERQIMGGIEGVRVQDWAKDCLYVALGHIHRAQAIGGNEHVRYSGSPLPMSFTERHYQHSVYMLTLENGAIQEVQNVPIPQLKPFLRLPDKHAVLDEVLSAIEQLPIQKVDECAPFLEILLKVDTFIPEWRFRLQEALKDKYAVLTRIDVKMDSFQSDEPHNDAMELQNLDTIQPLDMVQRLYEQAFQKEMPDDIKQLYVSIEQDVLANSDNA